MNQTIVHVSAPGKVILHGEHSVVYGKKAIAVSVGLLTTVTISPDKDFKIKFPDVGIDSLFTLERMKELKNSLRNDFKYEILNVSSPIPIWNDVQNILEGFCDTQVKLHCVDENLKLAQRNAFQAVLFMYLSIFEQPIGLCISIDTKLPVGAGLGSSASFASSLVGAILIAAGKISTTGTGQLPYDLINKWAFVSETFIHGSPSGVDNTVTTYGSGVIFQKGKDVEFIKDFPNIRALLVNTKVPRSTKVLVSKVINLKDTKPDVFKTIMDGIEEVVELAIHEIKQNKKVCPQLITRNHEYLKLLDVSHSSLEIIIQIAKEHSFSGKLTGAGGGGCAYILIPSETKNESVQSLIFALEKEGFELWDTILGCPGVAMC